METSRIGSEIAFQIRKVEPYAKQLSVELEDAHGSA